MTAQYVSTVLKRHAESAGQNPDEDSSHSICLSFNRCVEKAGTFQDNPAENTGP